MSKTESEAKQQQPNLHFFFLAHHDFDHCSEKLLPEMTSRNVVFMETVNLEGNSRQQTEALINLVLALPETLDAEQQRLQEKLIKELSVSKNFVSQFVYHLARTGKRFFFIDIDPGHPDFQLAEKSCDLLGLVIKSFKEGDLAQAEASHREYVAIRAKFHEARENEVKLQINRTVAHLQKEALAIRAAVIQGAIHQPTAGLFDRESYETEVSVLSGDITLEGQLWLKKRLGQEPTPVEYRRALLVLMLIENCDLEPGFNLAADRELTILVNKLPDNLLNAAFSQFELTYRQNLAQLTKRRRLTPSEKAMFAPAAFALTIESLLKTIRRWV